MRFLSSKVEKLLFEDIPHTVGRRGPVCYEDSLPSASELAKRGIYKKEYEVRLLHPVATPEDFGREYEALYELHLADSRHVVKPYALVLDFNLRPSAYLMQIIDGWTLEQLAYSPTDTQYDPANTECYNNLNVFVNGNGARNYRKIARFLNTVRHQLNNTDIRLARKHVGHGDVWPCNFRVDRDWNLFVADPLPLVRGKSLEERLQSDRESFSAIGVRLSALLDGITIS